MAEANLPDTGASIYIPTPDQFSRLDQFHRREAYKRLYTHHMMCIAEAKCNRTEELQAVRSEREGGPDTSAAMDQTLVGIPSTNAHQTALLESLTAKEVRNAELENKFNAVSKDKQNISEKLQNATEKNTEMQTMLKEKEKQLSASKAQCRALTLQVGDLHVQLKDREDRIHAMTESAPAAAAAPVIAPDVIVPVLGEQFVENFDQAPSAAAAPVIAPDVIVPVLGEQVGENFAEASSATPVIAPAVNPVIVRAFGVQEGVRFAQGNPNDLQ